MLEQVRGSPAQGLLGEELPECVAGKLSFAVHPLLRGAGCTWPSAQMGKGPSLVDPGQILTTMLAMKAFSVALAQWETWHPILWTRPICIPEETLSLVPDSL